MFLGHIVKYAITNDFLCQIASSNFCPIGIIILLCIGCVVSLLKCGTQTVRFVTLHSGNAAHKLLGAMCNTVNLTHLVHWVHIWFYLHYSCLEMLQTSCYYYTNASMSFSIFADRNVWCSQWEFSLFQGSSSFESCLCYNIWFSVFLLWSLQTCVNSSLVVLGMLKYHTGVTQMGDLLGWLAI